MVFSLIAQDGYGASMLLVDRKVSLTRVAVIEGMVKLPDDADANGPGLFFDLAISITRGVDMHFSQAARFRVVMKHDMMECYLNDFNGQICFLCGSDHKALEDK